MSPKQSAEINGANPNAEEVRFKARDGRWLPFSTPTSQIPILPPARARLDALLAQARAVHAEISTLLPAVRGTAV